MCMNSLLQILHSSAALCITILSFCRKLKFFAMLQVKGSELEQLTERIWRNIENLSKMREAVSYSEETVLLLSNLKICKYRKLGGQHPTSHQEFLFCLCNICYSQNEIQQSLLQSLLLGKKKKLLCAFFVWQLKIPVGSLICILGSSSVN